MLTKLRFLQLRQQLFPQKSFVHINKQLTLQQKKTIEYEQ